MYTAVNLLIELDLHFMIIYLCIKESNTLIFSKDIERKPFFQLFFDAEKGP